MFNYNPERSFTSCHRSRLFVYLCILSLIIISSYSQAANLSLGGISKTSLQGFSATSVCTTSGNCSTTRIEETGGDFISVASSYGRRYTFSDSLPDELSGSYAGEVFSHIDGSVSSDDGTIKLGFNANGEIRQLSEEQSGYELYIGTQSPPRIQHAIAGTITEDISFFIDESFAEQELWVTFTIYVDGDGFGFHQLSAALQAKDVTRKNYNGSNVYENNETEYRVINPTLDPLTWQEQLSISVLIQAEGEKVLRTDMRIYMALAISSLSLNAEGNFRNTANLYMDLPEGVTFTSTDNTFLSNQYIPNGDAYKYNCTGFVAPFDKALIVNNKAKGVIPVKFKLYDSDGDEITDMNEITPPVINVTFNGMVYGDGATDDVTLESVGSSNTGNSPSYNANSGYWEYRLGTKRLSSPGTYNVVITSGDTSEYLISEISEQCSQTFTRKN